MNFYIRYLLSAFVLFSSINIAQAQEDSFYYYKGEQIALNLNTNTIFVSSVDPNDISNINLEGTSFVLEAASKIQKDVSSQILLTPENFTSQTPTRYWREIVFSNKEISKEVYFKNIKTLKANNQKVIVSPYFAKSTSDKIGLSNYFYVKLKHQDDFNVLLQEIDNHGLELIGYNEFMPLWFTISVTPSSENTLKMANTFYETGHFADIDPAFMFNFRGNCKNDTDFNQLWGLLNNSNNSLDINACDAWNITEGNGVNVAVLDQGVYKTHNDLNGNISSLSYDSQNGSSPSVFTSGRDHGTHVAGTIAAEGNNNLQVVGVAPQSSIMSISHTLSVTPNISQELANGLNWAWQNGAEVINNSWGDQGGAFFGQLQSALLENAITNTLTLGRSGLGTIVVFAAGNQSPAIDYPASFHDEIICTGAMTSTGTRSSFSGFGGDLDLVAPGSAILSTIPTNGTASWNGTSMAAPHTAGVAALILSVDNGLTNIDVNDIIEQSAQKVRTDIYTYSTTAGRPNGTWNNQMGYGLLDAHAAVVLAQSYGCPVNANITVNINTGTLTQEAANTITATNTIGSSATAIYHAGDEVLLTSDFDALNGSVFRAYIEGCTGNFVSKSGAPPSNDEIHYVYPESKSIANTKDLNTGLKLFPNPTKGVLNIKLKGNTLDNATIEVYSFSGAKVYSNTIKRRNVTNHELDLSKFQTGIYIVKVTDTNGTTHVNKVIKE